ncbi:MAG: hypothetical protein WC455_23350 [Dehalococcoidia bacterium]|jgi:hypothetical protein
MSKPCCSGWTDARQGYVIGLRWYAEDDYVRGYYLESHSYTAGCGYWPTGEWHIDYCPFCGARLDAEPAIAEAVAAQNVEREAARRKYVGSEPLPIPEELWRQMTGKGK